MAYEGETMTPNRNWTVCTKYIHMQSPQFLLLLWKKSAQWGMIPSLPTDFDYQGRMLQQPTAMGNPACANVVGREGPGFERQGWVRVYGRFGHGHCGTRGWVPETNKIRRQTMIHHYGGRESNFFAKEKGRRKKLEME